MHFEPKTTEVLNSSMFQCDIILDYNLLRNMLTRLENICYSSI